LSLAPGVAASSPVELSAVTKSQMDSSLGLIPSLRVVKDHRSVVVPLSSKSRTRKRVTFRMPNDQSLVVQPVLPVAVAAAAAAPAPKLTTSDVSQQPSSSGVLVATRRSSRPATQAKAK